MSGLPTHMHALSGLRLWPRPDLQSVPLRFKRQRYWTIKDPLAQRYYQLREPEWFVWQCLDGRTDVRTIQQRFEQRFYPQRLSLAELHSFLSMLHREGLLVADAAEQGEVLLHRRDQQLRQRRWQQWTNPLAIRFRGVDPSWLLDRLEPRTRWLFSLPVLGLGIVATLVMSALLLVALRWGVMSEQLPPLDAFLTPSNVVYLALLAGAIKVVHELAHALVCRRLGGECHEVGLLLLCLMPSLYCNVSDAWMISDRWRRIAISAAGMAVEVVLAAAALWLWWLSEPGLFNTLALNVALLCSVSTLLINGNPLLRYDGYYILADLVETPNLAEQSSETLTYYVRQFFFGAALPEPLALPRRGHGWLALYAVLAMLYRLAVVGLILYTLHRTLAAWDLHLLAQLLAAMVIASVVMVPLRRAASALRHPLWRRLAKGRQALVRGTLLAALLGVVAFWPLPSSVVVPMVLQSTAAQRVYVTEPGQLRQMVQPGERVERGQPIAWLSSLQLERELASLDSALQEQRQRLMHIERLRDHDPTAGLALPAARAMLDDLQQRYTLRLADSQRLVLTAPCDGVVMPPPRREPAESATPQTRLPTWSETPLESRNLGCYLESGTLFCLIGEPEQLEALAVVSQDSVERLRPGQTARVAPVGAEGGPRLGQVVEVAQIDLDHVPEELALAGEVPLAGPGHQASQRAQAGSRYGQAIGQSQARPLAASYLARVRLDDPAAALLCGSVGKVKIRTADESLAYRLLRWLNQTFRIEMP